MTTTTENELKVTGEAPAMPVIVADAAYMAQLAKLGAVAEELAVRDAKSAQEAADLLGEATRMGRELEETRKRVKAPFLEMCRKIDGLAKDPAEKINAAKTAVQKKLTAHELAERRRREEAERKRREEMEALRKKQAEEEAARRAAEEEARKAAEEEESDWSDLSDLSDEFEVPELPTETEERIEELQAASAVPAASSRPTGVSFRCTLEVEVVDRGRVPDGLCDRVVNIQLVKARFCKPWKDGDPMPEVPGLKFRIDRKAVGRGRR